MITKKLISDYPICRYWTTFMQKIQMSLASDYVYYKTGFIPQDKLISVVNKLTDYYKLDLPNYERSKLHQANIATTVVHFFCPDDNTIMFILMGRAGANGSMGGLFFEREKYADSRVKANRIKFHCYEALQIQKQEIPDTPIKADLSWTWQLTKAEILRLKHDFSIANRHGNLLKIKQLCYGLRHIIGFHGVRRQYFELRTHYEKEFIRINKKPLSDICFLPEKIGFVKRRSEDNPQTLNDIIKVRHSL